MVIFNVELNNIYSFNDFKINFTYKKKPVNNPLKGEFLKGFPFFRYCKVSIITGSNAVGKTTLGKSIMGILNFIDDKNSSHILNAVNVKDKEASFVIDYYVGTGSVFRLDCVINPNAKTNNDLLIKYYEIKLQENDTYESYLKKLMDSSYSNNINDIQNQNLGWTFNFPLDSDAVKYSFDERYYEEYEDVLNKIIVTLDPAVEKVTRSKEMDKCFNVYFRNGMQPIPVEDGRNTRDLPRLSSGTKYAFNLAYIYMAIKEKLNGFYYVDEQFSYINNEIEKGFISLLCSIVGDDEQLIFTTHNTDVLDLNLPIHAYGFLKKDDLKITYTNASTLEKKNNVSIKNDYDNDLFGALPDLDGIYSLDALED